MADNQQAGMGQPSLVPGMRIVLEALDPDNGDVNFDVDISDVVISGDPEPGAADDGPEPGTPSWVWGDDTVEV